MDAELSVYKNECSKLQHHNTKILKEMEVLAMEKQSLLQFKQMIQELASKKDTELNSRASSIS